MAEWVDHNGKVISGGVCSYTNLYCPVCHYHTNPKIRQYSKDGRAYGMAIIPDFCPGCGADLRQKKPDREHAHWKNRERGCEYDWATCSACGGRTAMMYNYRYCPACGAEMSDEDMEEDHV